MNNKVQSKDQDFALEAVPQQGKKGFWSMFAVMLGFTFFSASMWTGGELGTSLTLNNFFIAVFLGNLILGIYTALLSYISTKTGLSTHLLARYSFGNKGSYLPSFLLGITQVGWFGVGVAMFALPVARVTGISLPLLIGVAGILMTATAYFGIKALTILSIIAVPSISILGSYSVFTAVDQVGGFSSLAAMEPTTTIGIGSALAMCVASFISGGTLTPDFSRFAKSTKVGVSTTIIAFFLGNSLMFIFGAIGAMVTGQSDISEVMFLQNLILPAIIILGFNIWTTNDNALYASGLGFANITKLPKNILVVFNGVLGTILALFLYNNFVGWLSFLNSIIPPVGGIIIADYFLVNKEKYSKFVGQQFQSVNYCSMGAWVAGVLASRYMPGIPPINGVIVAMVSFVAFSKAMEAVKTGEEVKLAS